ncbi:coenzyme Q-binding protein COQ10 homolog, mitochondrial-like isoform X1 [Olea europaea var. sylvestris]|uniref:coenzyme Q-binding protein COQ10 homolog, mitochondrial-like isoform X1 n=1 Tax=Olea europaea var. sylvestris TaxID=158386 RepID=UPI000C1CCC5A|nr:coenzyme Q-binding protein COQ10 homolog, mitochondrial-like isoform X1 [Olea europaea var. sylvestris]XP_022894772.1 coenzyme Q-binding protein COQ10 homolog, mitochondrial-like isoform X1 [Olea europaea var. sylvestris]
MPSFNPASKAFTRLFSCRDLFRRRIIKYSDFNQIRYLSTIGGSNAFSSDNKSAVTGYWNYNLRDSGIFPNNHNVIVQKRGFLGCGDGEEGNMLAKVHEERRVLGYSPEQLFGVVAAVDLYEDFVPWCHRSEIIRHLPDGSFDAELEIGFKFLIESYVSRVEFKKPKYVKTTSSQSSLFDHLINIWEFNEGPVPGTCNLYFLVDFKFQSPFYRQMANMFFKEVASRLVGSFNDRCKLIYGPGVPILENTFEQRS